MAQMELAGNMYEVDEHGFLQETDNGMKISQRPMLHEKA